MYKIKELSQAAVGKLYWTVSYKERREWQEGSGFELLHKDCLSKAPVVTRDADDPAVEVRMHIKDEMILFGVVWVCCRTVFLSTPPLLSVPPCISSGVTVSNRGIRPIRKLVLRVCSGNTVELFSSPARREENQDMWFKTRVAIKIF